MNRTKKQQQGIILIISVILLAVLSGLSIALLSGAVTEKTIAYQEQDQRLAKESVEYAVSMAKSAISASWGVGMTECSSTGCTCPSPPIPCVYQKSVFSGIDLTQQSAAYWNANATTAASPNSQVSSSPQYIIMDMGCDAVSSANLFRIVARGAGATQNAVAFSDVTFPMPFNSQNTASAQGAVTIYYSVNGNNNPALTISLSTSKNFYASGSSGAACPQGGWGYAECQVNCAGLVRVMARTPDNNCIDTYGRWASTASQISLTLSGSPRTFRCYYSGYASG